MCGPPWTSSEGKMQGFLGIDIAK
ncbi:MAG: hypothetical protein FD176_3365, partial [Rhodospirillaceae bacterium]